MPFIYKKRDTAARRSYLRRVDLTTDHVRHLPFAVYLHRGRSRDLPALTFLGAD
jgi:hypothetical protein